MRMPRLFWVFAGRTVILLVLSWRGSLMVLYLTSLCINISRSVFIYKFIHKWATIWQNQQNAYAPSEDSDQLRPVWSMSSLCAQWAAKDPNLFHADSEDSGQTGRMSRLIWVFAGRTAILLVLSCSGSNIIVQEAVAGQSDRLQCALLI